MDSEEDATSCLVCRETYSDPRSLPCGHCFCLDCLKGVAGNMQKFPCPICRLNVNLGHGNVDQLPKNFVLCNIIEARDKTNPSMCLDHKRSLDLFCEGCDVVICSKCLSMKHKCHAIEDIEIIFIERNKQLATCLERTKQWASMAQEKRDIVKQSRISMEKNIDSISKTVEIRFKKWQDALKEQHSVILSYIHQERDLKRQVFSETERILEGSMAIVNGLNTAISKLTSKGMAIVIQEYGSVKARQEETERKILHDIETCFTPPDNLKIEVYAPWIEEAIDNIKPIDIKQKQARPGPQTIAEIQGQNVMIKRECKKLRNTLEELEERLSKKKEDYNALHKTCQELERDKERKMNEVTNLEYWNQCLDTLVQHLHDHVVAGTKSTPRTLIQPDEIKPNSLLAKRYQHAQDICAQFTKVENDIKELKDKSFGQGIIMAALDEYVTSKKQNISLDIPSAIHLDRRFVLECGQAKRIAQGFEEKKRDLSASKQEMAIKTKTYTQNRFENLRAEHEKLKTAYTNLQKTFKEADAEKSRLEDNNKEMQYIRSCPNQEKVDIEGWYERQIQNRNQEIAQMRQEKESLLIRLSKLAGDRLTHDNVNIADLSDADRPTKLSEVYSELYDNEWTDAFEELTENIELSDEAAVAILLKILMNAFRKCKEITWKRYDSLKVVASTLNVKQEHIPLMITKEEQPLRTASSNSPTTSQIEEKTNEVPQFPSQTTHENCTQSASLTCTLSIDQEKSLKNIWRATSIKLKDESLKLLSANLMNCLGKHETEMPKTFKYLTCCTELCWKMGVQEKPMHLDVNAEKEIGQEKQFDTDKFRPYTKYGEMVAYIVWPALFLYEGGVMLAKGIAQGCRK